jgi:hypothetical protein
MPLVTSALCCGRNRRGREGHRADRKPGTGARKRVGHGGVNNLVFRAKYFGDLHNRRWLPIKKFNFFIALKTLNENGVETGKQPSRPRKISVLLCQVSAATVVLFNVCKASATQFAVQQKRA